MNSEIRDLVHWNGILTADQIEDLYNANNCYTSPAWAPTASLGDNIFDIGEYGGEGILIKNGI